MSDTSNPVHQINFKKSGSPPSRFSGVGVQCPLFRLVYILFIVFLFFHIRLIDNIHLGYFILMLLFPVAFYFRRVTFRLNIFDLFFLIVTGTSLAAYTQYGYDLESIRLVIMMISYYFGYWSLKSVIFRYDDIVKKSTILFFVLYYLRNIIFYKDFIMLFSGGRASIVQTFHSTANGGMNIECTILAFIAMLQTRKNYFYFSFINALFFSTIFGSRVGLILTLMALVFWVYKGKTINYKNIVKLAVIFSLVLSILVFLSTFLPKGNAISRFNNNNIEQELYYGNKGIGRIGFLLGSFVLLEKNIFGYGSTNSVRVMSEVTGINHLENNVHNIFLQFLLDGGIQSLIIFMIIFFLITRYLIKDKFLFPPLRIAFSYLVIGLLQFTGYDLIGWFFLGTSYGYIRSQSYLFNRPCIKHRNLDKKFTLTETAYT